MRLMLITQWWFGFCSVALALIQRLFGGSRSATQWVQKKLGQLMARTPGLAKEIFHTRNITLSVWVRDFAGRGWLVFRNEVDINWEWWETVLGITCSFGVYCSLSLLFIIMIISSRWLYFVSVFWAVLISACKVHLFFSVLLHAGVAAGSKQVST